jgi:hypothetical protein
VEPETSGALTVEQRDRIEAELAPGTARIAPAAEVSG